MGEIIKFQDSIDPYSLEKIKINNKINQYRQLLKDKNNDEYQKLTEKINNYISSQNLSDLFYKIRQSEKNNSLLYDEYAYDSNQCYHDDILNGLITLRYLKMLLEQNDNIELIASIYVLIENQVAYIKTMHQYYVQYLRDVKRGNYDGSNKTKLKEKKLFMIAFGSDYLISDLHYKIDEKKKSQN